MQCGQRREDAHLCSLCLWSQVTVEEVMTTTAYLDLFLRSISEPALLETFLRFILLHQHENVHILDTLTSRINTPFRVRSKGTRTPEVCFGNEIANIPCSPASLRAAINFYLGRDELDTPLPPADESFCQGSAHCLSWDIFPLIFQCRLFLP